MHVCKLKKTVSQAQHAIICACIVGSKLTFVIWLIEYQNPCICPDGGLIYILDLAVMQTLRSNADKPAQDELQQSVWVVTCSSDLCRHLL